MILPVVTLKFAPVPVVVAPIGAAGLVKQAAPVEPPEQKVASSAFNQLVAQMVAESAGPEIAATPATAVKPLPKPITIPVAPVGDRRAGPSNPSQAQPPSVPVDLNTPVPIGPNVQLPSLAGEGSPEQEPATPPAVKLPPHSTASPADQSSELPAPVRTAPAPFIEPSTLTVAPVGSRRAAASNPGPAQPPSVPVDVSALVPIAPVPIAPKLQLPPLAGGGAPAQKPATPAAVSKAEETAPIALEPKPILQLKIRLVETPVVENETASVAPSSVVGPSVKVDAAKPIAAAPDIAAQKNPDRGSADQGDADARPSTEPSGHPVSRTVVNTVVTSVVNQEAVAIVQPPAQPLVHDPVTAPVAALPAPPPSPAPVAARSAAPEAPTASALLREEPPSDPIKTQQPLRSMALEFAPDGAGDIKVRLSERSGDVHISLHGTDSLLAGRVREGVGDLVGSLSKAGYDAEAWTPGEGRQNQRQQPDRRQPAPDTGKPDPEEFSGILQQPIQEIS